MEAMTAPIQNKLEEVVGLTSILSQQFCDHVTHTVEKHLKDEKKLMDYDTTSTRSIWPQTVLKRGATGLANSSTRPNFGYWWWPENPKGRIMFPKIIILGADEEPMQE